MAIAARPTTYRGINMRSRLEARFAAFLDGQDFTWEYEPRAFAGSAGQYLPDFRIQMGPTPLYVDIKGAIDADDLGAALVALQRRMRVILESEPGAVLAIIPDDLMRRPGRTFLLDLPSRGLDPRRFLAGFFGVCASCHRTSVGAGNTLWCHRCGTRVAPVARLDPFHRPEAI